MSEKQQPAQHSARDDGHRPKPLPRRTLTVRSSHSEGSTVVSEKQHPVNTSSRDHAQPPKPLPRKTLRAGSTHGASSRDTFGEQQSTASLSEDAAQLLTVDSTSESTNPFQAYDDPFCLYDDDYEDGQGVRNVKDKKTNI
ncbi:uncharacterized protein [Watersipora subatra]|uniref:uncharacterized protein n=1 Tax=Watersipora subatra TaxID=2589382 RepID=UPI00355C5D80